MKRIFENKFFSIKTIAILAIQTQTLWHSLKKKPKLSRTNVKVKKTTSLVTTTYKYINNRGWVFKSQDTKLIRNIEGFTF